MLVFGMFELVAEELVALDFEMLGLKLAELELGKGGLRHRHGVKKQWLHVEDPVAGELELALEVPPNDVLREIALVLPGINFSVARARLKCSPPSIAIN